MSDTDKSEANQGLTQAAKQTGTWVVAALLVASTILGTIGFFRYKHAEQVLMSEMTDLRQLGTTMDVEGCADRVLDRFMHCDVMRSLCDAEVPRMMDACLGAQLRDAYCQSVAVERRSTGFGYDKCAKKGLQRREMKACAAIFRTIDKYCDRRLLSANSSI
ncbi:MAG: hypothetical protein HUU55_07900 [Myxococcales bacterium]|nr:hypothetical protein [Myxococcales bacterium]